MSNRPRAPWFSVLVFLLLAWPGPSAPASGKAPRSAPEYNVKAAYILLFIRYVTWPSGSFAAPDTPITVGILGWDPFGKVLDETLEGMSVNGRRLEPRRLDDVNGARNCHVVFMARDEQSRLAGWVRELGNRPILTIAESPEAIAAGAMVNFILEGNTIRFEIGRTAAEKSGMRIASPMMVSAKKIHGGPPTGREED